MLFTFEDFCLRLKEDERAILVLQNAISHASEQISPGDLLISVIDSRDTKILTFLLQALEPGCTISDLRDLIEVYHPASKTPKQVEVSVADFSPTLLEALRQFSMERSNNDGKLHEAVLEHLLACVLERLNAEECECLTILNIEQCIALLREKINQINEQIIPLFDPISGELLRTAFSENGWRIMENAANYATNLGYSCILPPHCFLALLSENGGVAEHIIRLQLKPEIEFEKVLHVIEKAFRISKQPAKSLMLSRYNLHETTVNLLDKAQEIIVKDGKKAINNVSILSALLEAIPTQLVPILQDTPLNINLEKLKDHLTSYLSHAQTLDIHEIPLQLPSTLLPSEDLTYLAHIGGISRSIPINSQKKSKYGNDPYDLINRALHRHEKNHVLITGLQGVGKTSLVREVACRAAVGSIPFLKQKRFLRVDCQDVSSYESKEILRKIFSFVSVQSDIILCLDGLGQLLRAETKGGNNLLLRKTLKEGHFHLIGILSNRDYDELLSSDFELLELFTRVNIDEPEEEVALAIAKQACIEFEHIYQVRIEARAIERALLLSTNYILNERLPAKVIKILRQACEELDYERVQCAEKRAIVNVSDVIKMVTRISGVPEETLAGVVDKVDYEKDIATIVIGQNEAVKTVASELRRIKAGWTDPHKPASVMLFAGLTGVGKTELAKVVAQFYSSSKRLQTYTMGNFTEPHSVSGIIGSPPGYIGHTQGGRLINDLNADPYCVFLLDEAEKAHPEVWKPFLNLFDEAWITDTQGTTAYADKSIFILTSNAGSEIISHMWQTGERNMDKILLKVKEALLQIRHERSNQPVFTPEFIARIRHIVIFRPLDLQAIEGICRKHLLKMQQAWKEKREKNLIVPDSLIKHIARLSHQENQRSGNKEGGRIVEKLLSELINENILREQLRREDDYRNADIIEFIFEPSKGNIGTLRYEDSGIRIEFRQQTENVLAEPANHE
ncbi:MAG TPA: AAA family ATPase [Ktedonobacteraceae bacterium]|nr:AAA family ATPase [Ktedonobacteraceae bacterium]